MCGITGIIHLDGTPLPKSKLVRFTDSLKHRGPDGSGYFIDASEPVGLGHRRLAILDLSKNADQPMPFAEGRYWIAYNGEVFNFLEIRAELRQLGYNFRTESDTEVVLAAYHCWGVQCLTKFNGMWAIAIWDVVTKEIFLARDRFGVKPLYYLHKRGTIFAFASETYAFKFLDDYQRDWDSDKIKLNISDTFALEGKGHTIFKDTLQLLPGHFLKINLRNFNIQQRRWWSTLDNLPAVPGTYEQQVQRFAHLFQDATLLRLRSDVPIATALSGGVDSSAVYCMLKSIARNSTLEKERLPENWQRAFVATFPGTGLDEKAYAEQVISYTQGDAIFVPPNYSNLVDDIVNSTIMVDAICGTPLSVVSAIYGAMRQNGYKISMDGHGVDEMLLGYPHFLEIAYADAAQKKDQMAESYWDTLCHLYTAETQSNLTRPITPQKNWNLIHLLKMSLRKHMPEFLKNSVRRLIQRPTDDVENSWLRQAKISALEELSDRKVDISGLNAVDRALYAAFHQTILPSILRNFDRASMQNSIEIRMPFMDYRLVSYVFALPLTSKVGGGFTKRILRDAMRGSMPEDIRTRKFKIGLNAPMIEWFGNELSELILDETRSKNFLSSNIWNGPVIADFAASKIKNRDWTWTEAWNFWGILNAHILMSRN